MKDYLVWQLAGPLASWGDIAVGEDRHTAQRPSKSAILGMVAAALGIERTDDAFHSKLHRQLNYGSATIQSGTMIRDYHTVQIVKSVRKAVYATRKDELDRDPERVGTLLSKRDYLCDSLCLVALSGVDDGALAMLSEISAALIRPRFVTYLGRKSCAPMLPFSPRTLRQESFQSAFTEALSDYWSLWIKFGMCASLTRHFDVAGAWEGEPGAFKVDRNDGLHQRSRWQFRRREEYEQRFEVDV